MTKSSQNDAKIAPKIHKQICVKSTSGKVCKNDVNMFENGCPAGSQNRQKATKMEVKKKAEKTPNELKKNIPGMDRFQETKTTRKLN